MAKKRPSRKKGGKPKLPKWMTLLSKKIESSLADDRQKRAKRNGAH